MARTYQEAIERFVSETNYGKYPILLEEKTAIVLTIAWIFDIDFEKVCDDLERLHDLELVSPREYFQMSGFNRFFWGEEGCFW